jgi:hypothetical protein
LSPVSSEVTGGVAAVGADTRTTGGLTARLSFVAAATVENARLIGWADAVRLIVGTTADEGSTTAAAVCLIAKAGDVAATAIARGLPAAPLIVTTSIAAVPTATAPAVRVIARAGITAAVVSARAAGDAL